MLVPSEQTARSTHDVFPIRPLIGSFVFADVLHRCYLVRRVVKVLCAKFLP